MSDKNKKNLKSADYSEELISNFEALYASKTSLGKKEYIGFSEDSVGYDPCLGFFLED